MWNLVLRSTSRFGSALAMTSSRTASCSALLETSAACWVETTTVSMRAGRPSRYSTETWLLPSGRRKSRPALRTLASCRVRAWAYWMGAGISSGVSLQA